MNKIWAVGLALFWMAANAAAQLNVSAPSTGSAAPGTAVFVAGNSSGNMAGIVGCDSSALLSVSTATTTQIVALSGTKSVYVCGDVINGGGATTVKFVYGTGTACATGLVSLTPAFTLASGTNVSLGGGLGYVMKAPSGNALCVTTSAAVAANIHIAYTQF